MIQVEIKHPSDSLLEFVRHLQLENRRKIEELKNDIMTQKEIILEIEELKEFLKLFGAGHLTLDKIKEMGRNYCGDYRIISTLERIEYLESLKS